MAIQRCAIEAKRPDVAISLRHPKRADGQHGGGISRHDRDCGVLRHRRRTPRARRSGDVDGPLAYALVRWPALVVLLMAVGLNTAGMAHSSKPTPSTR